MKNKKINFWRSVWNWLLKGGYSWLIGAKIGLVSFFVILPVFFYCIAFPIEVLVTNTLGFDVSNCHMFLCVPTILGVFFLLFFLILAGAIVGSFFDVIKKVNFLTSSFFILIGVIMVLYYFVVNFSTPPKKCEFLFDFSPGFPRSECFLNNLKYKEKSNSLSYCDKIKIKSSKCEDLIISNVNEEQCQELNFCNQFSNKDACLEKCMLHKQELKNCMIHLTEKSSEKVKNNISKCLHSSEVEKFEKCYEQSKDICYSKLAKQIWKIENCNKIEALNKKEECYHDLAYQKKDINICHKINKSSLKNSCYLLVASKKKNSKPCQNINKDQTKKKCIKIANRDDIDAWQTHDVFKKGNLNLSLELPLFWKLVDNKTNKEIIPKEQVNCVSQEGADETCIDKIKLKYYENRNNLNLETFFRKKFGWKKGTNFKNVNTINVNDYYMSNATLIYPHDGEEDPSVWIGIASGYYKISGNYLERYQEEIFDKIVQSIEISK